MSCCLLFCVSDSRADSVGIYIPYSIARSSAAVMGVYLAYLVQSGYLEPPPVQAGGAIEPLPVLNLGRIQLTQRTGQ